MTQTDERFRDLMARVLTGSDEAAEELFRKYEHYLLKAIRLRLPARIRSKFDSLDFAQDVWGSFFAEPAEKRNFDNPQALLVFLTKLAHNKVIDAVRQRLNDTKFSVNQEESLDDSTKLKKEELLGPAATPSQIVGTEDDWRAFLLSQPLVNRRAYILLREGKTHEEIAQELGLHPRTIKRMADKIDLRSKS
jgi:RNA polymerase sigma-70 factor (ECF subfamily)